MIFWFQQFKNNIIQEYKLVQQNNIYLFYGTYSL